MRHKLVALRSALGLTQERAAQMIGVSRSFYAGLESGARSPSLEVIQRFIKTFGPKTVEFFLPIEVASRVVYDASCGIYTQEELKNMNNSLRHQEQQQVIGLCQCGGSIILFRHELTVEVGGQPVTRVEYDCFCSNCGDNFPKLAEPGQPEKEVQAG